jgi:hypothetical protein
MHEKIFLNLYTANLVNRIQTVLLTILPQWPRLQVVNFLIFHAQ